MLHPDKARLRMLSKKKLIGYSKREAGMETGIMGILLRLLVFVYTLTPFSVLALLVFILGIESITYGAIRLFWAIKEDDLVWQFSGS